jgi:hypothetical protein
MEIQVFKMRPGEYVEDVDLEAALDDHFDSSNPVLDAVHASVHETDGDAKNRLAFGIQTIDPAEAIEQELFEEMEAVVEAKNAFLEAVTGRDASLRKEDMKTE